MAFPANPLDEFVTYTYHFELYMAATDDEIVKAETVDLNVATARDRGNGPLLINTRRDAHQAIDSVRFISKNAYNNGISENSYDGNITFNVIEPSGAFFIHKLLNQRERYNIKNEWIGSSIVYGLKILFVGRTASNEIKTVQAKMIRLTLVNIAASFDHRGSVYHLIFTRGPDSPTGDARTDTTLARMLYYPNKSIAIKAKTVTEALRTLETNLNANYEEIYARDIKTNDKARKLKYKIILDPKLKGKLYATDQDSFSPDDYSKLSFNADTSIIDIIQQVLMTSKEINEYISDSRAGLKKEFHPGVKLIIIQPNYVLTAAAGEVTFEVGLYAPDKSNTKVYEFDYLFSDPGRNVDILSFDLKLVTLVPWFADHTSLGPDQMLNRWKNENKSPEEAAYFANQILHGDTTRKNTQVPKEPNEIDIGSGVAAMPVAMQSDRTSLSIKSDALPSARLHFSTNRDAAGAGGGGQVTFTVRGYLPFLQDSISQPLTGTHPPIAGLWLKVNIKDQDGFPFFYTGHYRVNAIENIFENGKFIQHVHVQMCDEQFNSDVAAMAAAQSTAPAYESKVRSSGDSQTVEARARAGVAVAPSESKGPTVTQSINTLTDKANYLINGSPIDRSNRNTQKMTNLGRG